MLARTKPLLYQGSWIREKVKIDPMCPVTVKLGFKRTVSALRKNETTLHGMPSASLNTEEKILRMKENISATFPSTASSIVRTHHRLGWLDGRTVHSQAGCCGASYATKPAHYELPSEFQWAVLYVYGLHRKRRYQLPQPLQESLQVRMLWVPGSSRLLLDNLP